MNQEIRGSLMIVIVYLPASTNSIDVKKFVVSMHKSSASTIHMYIYKSTHKQRKVIASLNSATVAYDSEE